MLLHKTHPRLLLDNFQYRRRASKKRKSEQSFVIEQNTCWMAFNWSYNDSRYYNNSSNLLYPILDNHKRNNLVFNVSGTAVVKGLLPRMLLLWRNSFPRSNKELESEKARGDAFTWQVTLEGRAGALSAMHSFLLHCPELLNDDITRRLLTPIESALAMLTKYVNHYVLAYT